MHAFDAVKSEETSSSLSSETAPTATSVAVSRVAKVKGTLAYNGSRREPGFVLERSCSRPAELGQCRYNTHVMVP